MKGLTDGVGVFGEKREERSGNVEDAAGYISQ